MRSTYAKEIDLTKASWTWKQNAFLYLHRNSCHSKHVVSGLTKGKTIHHIKNVTDPQTLINRIGGVTVVWWIVGWSPDLVKKKKIQLVFAASPLSTQY